MPSPCEDLRPGGIAASSAHEVQTRELCARKYAHRTEQGGVDGY